MAINKINFEGLSLEPVQRRNFKEILNYDLKKNETTHLHFHRFHKMCGVSYQQWLVFREKNPNLKCSF